MKTIVRTGIFKKDYKRMFKRGVKEEDFIDVLKLLLKGVILPERYKTHRLIGNYSPFWECHIYPDWLLIYEYSETEIILRRTGTHSDLFK